MKGRQAYASPSDYSKITYTNLSMEINDNADPTLGIFPHQIVEHASSKIWLGISTYITWVDQINNYYLGDSCI